MNYSPMTVLAFDYGTRYIGSAVGQSLIGNASALTVIKVRQGKPDWAIIDKLVSTWQPTCLVVGLPLNMDGSDSVLMSHVETFVHQLKQRFGLSVHTFDERLSSFAARGLIIEQTGSRDFRRHAVDSLAAKLILESWFRSLDD